MRAAVVSLVLVLGLGVAMAAAPERKAYAEGLTKAMRKAGSQYQFAAAGPDMTTLGIATGTDECTKEFLRAIRRHAGAKSLTALGFTAIYCFDDGGGEEEIPVVE
jgi:hypothetical protein